MYVIGREGAHTKLEKFSSKFRYYVRDRVKSYYQNFNKGSQLKTCQI